MVTIKSLQHFVVSFKTTKFKYEIKIAKHILKMKCYPKSLKPPPLTLSSLPSNDLNKAYKMPLIVKNPYSALAIYSTQPNTNLITLLVIHA